MALPERHTDVSIHGFIEISFNTKVYQKIIILYFKISKQGMNSKVSFRTSTAAFDFSQIFDLNTMHT